MLWNGQMRYPIPRLREDLQKKKVLLAGPRKCGKTMLAKSLLNSRGEYLNWDITKNYFYRLHPIDPAESKLFLPGLTLDARVKRLLLAGGAPTLLSPRTNSHLQIIGLMPRITTRS